MSEVTYGMAAVLTEGTDIFEMEKEVSVVQKNEQNAVGHPERAWFQLLKAQQALGVDQGRNRRESAGDNDELARHSVRLTPVLGRGCFRFRG